LLIAELKQTRSYSIFNQQSEINQSKMFRARRPR